MDGLFKEVQRIYGSVEARQELDAKIRQGDSAAAELFFYFSLWRGIKEDRTYDATKKPRLFKALIDYVKSDMDLNFQFTKGQSAAGEAIG